MKVYYSIEIRMHGTYEVEDRILESASHMFGFSKQDIDEQDVHSVSVMFTSDLPPTEMRNRVAQFLVANHAVHYVDVIYRFEYAMVPDRFVRWRDGKIQESTGYIDFREDV